MATAFVAATALVTVTMPFAYKWATDALVHATGGTVPLTEMNWLIAAPILATALYGVIRITMTLLSQVREGLFAKVASSVSLPF